MNLNDKLAKNYYQPENTAHIVVAGNAQQSALKILLNACPAGLYRMNETGEITFDPNGCLECGTCRIVCHDEAFSLWRYPAAGCGVTFRFG
ncbi:ferredoxin family protein [Rahnella sp. Lac-M11]|uniref:Ferredoxin-like protein n=1 Tax=Rahnella contaminans TaxID=2703882 RepID=A0A6M2B6F1_9GAMM|nr:ferredoxin family protein [Rahnella sp. BIGb0603]MCS3422133.1 ferredoxin-like protein FixX [Rahnella sp. BIGb0603]MDF1893192.1 ferredoxin family protein [Rahnella contaminans]NGX88054.1 ferredoxin family protein [Rahnella contaminans]